MGWAKSRTFALSSLWHKKTLRWGCSALSQFPGSDGGSIVSIMRRRCGTLTNKRCTPARDRESERDVRGSRCGSVKRPVGSNPLYRIPQKLSLVVSSRHVSLLVPRKGPARARVFLVSVWGPRLLTFSLHRCGPQTHRVRVVRGQSSLLLDAHHVATIRNFTESDPILRAAGRTNQVTMWSSVSYLRPQSP